MKGRRNVPWVISVIAVASLAAAGYLLYDRGTAAREQAQPAASPPVAAGVTGGDSPRAVRFSVGEGSVKRIHVDGEQVWVGTSRGVIRYNDRTGAHHVFDSTGGLPAGAALFVGALGEAIAAGFAGGGLALYEPQSDGWRRYGMADGIADLTVHDALRASNGDIWIATWGGVSRVRGGALDDRTAWQTYTTASTKGGLPGDRTYGLAESRDGTVWVATNRGVAMFRNGSWHHWKLRDRQAASGDNKGAVAGSADPTAHGSDQILSVAADGGGNVWAGTFGAGLVRFDGRHWQGIGIADGLPGENVFLVHVDRGGQVWVGTEYGLGRLRPGGGFDVLGKREGLYANAVYAMAMADDGTLWVGGPGGVARIPPNPRR